MREKLSSALYEHFWRQAAEYKEAEVGAAVSCKD